MIGFFLEINFPPSENNENINGMDMSYVKVNHRHGNI